MRRLATNHVSATLAVADAVPPPRICPRDSSRARLCCRRTRAVAAPSSPCYWTGDALGERHR